MTEQRRIGFVGAGAVGSALARALHRHYPIHVVISKRSASAKVLSKRIRCKTFGNDFRLLADCNWIFVTTPDSALAQVVRQLSNISFASGTVHIVHTSGVYPSAILEPVKNNKSGTLRIASMHPMQTFPRISKKDHGAADLRGVYFGIEGDASSLKSIRHMVRQIGATPVTLRRGQKELYHAGGVIASNFLAALLFAAGQLYTRIGLSEKQTLAILMPIIQTTLRNILKNGIQNSLTGPAARRDYRTIRAHRKSLVPFDPEIKILYNVMTRLCLTMTHSTMKKMKR